MRGTVYETETSKFLKHMKGGDIPFYVDRPEGKTPDMYFYRGYSIRAIDLSSDWTTAVGELMRWASVVDEDMADRVKSGREFTGYAVRGHQLFAMGQ